jgi:hypothetical protein
MAMGVAARMAPWLAAIAVALPVLVYRYPPMFDLPNHEEIVAAMGHFGDESRYPPGLLVWNLGHPNQLFYVLAWAVSLVAPADMACKIVVAACVAGVPLAAARLADHLGTTRWAAVAVAPLGLGFVFYFGFVGNLLGYALFLASLPILDALATAPDARRATLGALALLALYEAHESALVAGGLALLVLSAARTTTLRPVRAIAYRAAPLVAAGLLVLFEQVRAVRAMGPNLRDLPPVIDLALWQKVDGASQALFGLHGADATRLPFYLLLASILLLATDRVRAWSRGARVALRERIDAERFTLLGLLLVIAYFEVPFSFQGAMWLHARFLAPGLAVLAVALAPREGSPGPSIVTRVVSLASVAATLAMLRPAFEATSGIYRDLDPLLARIELGSAVAPVDLVGGPLRNIVLSVGAASARAAAVRGGRVAVSFVQSSPIPPVIVAPAHRWDGAMQRATGGGGELRPAFDLARFRYVLAFVPENQTGRLTRALAPEARLVSRSGSWMLFESTLPLSSLLAPEPPLDHSESLAARLEAIERADGVAPP